MKQIYLWLLVGVLSVTIGMEAQTPAFPGAEGGGKYTTGGRGGTVYYVTSLEDTNVGNSSTKEGTLRWCLNQTGTRTILFKVSGHIRLTSRLSISKGNVTIAGQTAPGDGIMLSGYDVYVGADNVIIRYLRFRLGTDNAQEQDAIWGRYRRNIILDHCSMSWSVDECASFYSNENFTMQWCLLAESLRMSLHVKKAHGYGGLWGGKNATFHHNLLAHHDSRNPRFNGWKRSGLGYNNPMDEERMDFRNNVIYNWYGNTSYGGEALGKYNVVNNYYKPGPATSSSKHRFVQADRDASPDYAPGHGYFYVTGNVMHSNATLTNDNTRGIVNNSGAALSNVLKSEPFDSYPISQHSAEQAFDKVMQYAGASLARDVVDRRIVGEVTDGSFTYRGSKGNLPGIIDAVSDVGGWPTYEGTTAPTDSNRDGIPDGWLEANYPGKTALQLNEEGYTYLEIYLNSLVEPITTAQLAGGLPSHLKMPTATDQQTTHVAFDEATGKVWIDSKRPVDKIVVYSLDGSVQKHLSTQGGQVIDLQANDWPSGWLLLRLIDTKGNSETIKVWKSK